MVAPHNPVPLADVDELVTMRSQQQRQQQRRQQDRNTFHQIQQTEDITTTSQSQSDDEEEEDEETMIDVDDYQDQSVGPVPGSSGRSSSSTRTPTTTRANKTYDSAPPPPVKPSKKNPSNYPSKPSVTKPSTTKPSISKPSSSTSKKGGSPSTTKKGGSPSTKKGGNQRPGRHASRRSRFRFGVWNAGQSLRVLDEDDEHEDDYDEGYDDPSTFTGAGYTEQTSVGTDVLSAAMFSKKSRDGSDSQKSCWGSRWFQLFLVLTLIGTIVLAVLIFFFGLFGFVDQGDGSAASVDPEELMNYGYGPQEPLGPYSMVPYEEIDFTWDRSILDEDAPPKPIRDLLPGFTLDSLKDPDSYQSQAVNWIEAHPAGVEGLPNWKKLQLLALVSFYHAFDGKGWPEEKRKDWLSYEVDECSWGDPGIEGQYFGVGCTEGVMDVNGTIDETTRRYTELNLDWFLGFGLVGFPDAATGNQIPPEVVFLQDLETLGMMNCGLSAILSSLLPPTLLDMPKLRRLSFRYNNIAGTIPSYLGGMTQLEYLSLGSNFITGTLPAHLGGLTDVRELFLYSNELVGSFPYNWHKLTALTEFSAISNEITGRVPSYVAEWPDLEFFFVDHNPLKESDLPTEICELPELTSVLLPCSVNCATECGDKCECY